ncbi:hypothetical protein NGM33_16470 [Nocardiopsis dassonvillei]|jgi:hypothetical protein|uniref:hypothetical protein n=1 Tax=Nocardiopsis dassonvillei TaxID=2014 RepID=UPI00102CC32C|nr:hypothetical protein [Nocardiopsis dassonvillei]MCP3014926.1 hypothetical protein [Nocardiopsis dassonvillei]
MVERVPGPGTSRETESDQYRARTPGTGTGPRTAEPVTVDAEVNDPGRGTGPAGHARPGGRGTAPGRAPEQPGAGADRPDAADGPRARGAKLERVRERWNATQGKFVDDPHGAVREADALAAEVADAVVAEIEERRSALRSAWNEGEGTDTESLRVALRDYRSFVEHLVNTNT